MIYSKKQCIKHYSEKCIYIKYSGKCIIHDSSIIHEIVAATQQLIADIRLKEHGKQERTGGS